MSDSCSTPSPTDSTSSSQRFPTSPDSSLLLDPKTRSHSSSSSSCASLSSSSDVPFHSRAQSFATDGDRRTSMGSMTSWMESDLEDSLDRYENTKEGEGSRSPSMLFSTETASPQDLDAFPTTAKKYDGYTARSSYETRLAHRHSKSDMNDSSADSTSRSSPSKDGATPRAEAPPLVWPLASLSKLSARQAGRPGALGSTSSINGESSVEGKHSLQAASRRTGHEDLDASVASATTAFAAFSSLRDIPAFKASALPPAKTSQPPRPLSGSLVNEANSKSKSTSGEDKITPSTPPRRNVSLPASTMPSPMSAKTSRWGAPPSTPPLPRQQSDAKSTSSGCSISAPISPPAHYPLPTPPASNRNTFASFVLETPSSSSCSMSTSVDPTSATSVRTRSSSSSRSEKPPPKWARPPSSGKAMSLSGLGVGAQEPTSAPKLAPAPDLVAGTQTDTDSDTDLIDEQDGEHIELVKGCEGRIAVKSTVKEYIVLVWLPGFSIGDITIATRGSRTIHLVADHWDEGDHAQWDIKLGADANFGAVAAKFTGDELRISVGRHAQRSGANTYWGQTESKIGNDPGQRAIAEAAREYQQFEAKRKGSGQTQQAGNGAGRAPTYARGGSTPSVSS